MTLVRTAVRRALTRMPARATEANHHSGQEGRAIPEVLGTAALVQLSEAVAAAPEEERQESHARARLRKVRALLTGPAEELPAMEHPAVERPTEEHQVEERPVTEHPKEVRQVGRDMLRKVRELWALVAPSPAEGRQPQLAAVSAVGLMVPLATAAEAVPLLAALELLGLDPPQ